MNPGIKILHLPSSFSEGGWVGRGKDNFFPLKADEPQVGQRREDVERKRGHLRTLSSTSPDLITSSVFINQSINQSIRHLIRNILSPSSLDERPTKRSGQFKFFQRWVGWADSYSREISRYDQMPSIYCLLKKSNSSNILKIKNNYIYYFQWKS